MRTSFKEGGKEGTSEFNGWRQCTPQTAAPAAHSAQAEPCGRWKTRRTIWCAPVRSKRRQER
jgi:hypothetical protein